MSDEHRKWEKQARKSLEVYSPRSYRWGQALVAGTFLKVILAIVAFATQSYVWATCLGCAAVLTAAAGVFLILEHGPRRDQGGK